MLLEASLEEDLESFYHLYLDSPEAISLTSPSLRVAASSTLSQRSKTESHASLITTPPELRLRNPVPEPQNGPADCSQAAQSASQAIQQATQQASQSISQAQQQASQSISQAQREAAQSASQAIQQFSNSASQSIAAASRSASAASQSASFAIASASSQMASMQSSADAAVSRANASMMNAQASATIAQVCPCSKHDWRRSAMNYHLTCIIVTSFSRSSSGRSSCCGCNRYVINILRDCEIYTSQT